MKKSILVVLRSLLKYHQCQHGQKKDKILLNVDANEEKYIGRLKELVEIPSVSAWPEKRQDIVKCCNWTADKLKELGATIEMQELGMQKMSDGTEIPLPPLVFGHLGNDPKKKDCPYLWSFRCTTSSC